MKAYFLNTKQILSIIEMGQRNPERNRYIGLDGYTKPEDLAERIAKGLDTSPIELTDTSIGELKDPCKFFPMRNIVGFVVKDGQLKGVFVKESDL